MAEIDFLLKISNLKEAAGNLIYFYFSLYTFFHIIIFITLLLSMIMLLFAQNVRRP